jgi:myo-inositol 2-dehydrogenase/D-chiro-inositol 1-dehydrogenase
MLGRFGRVRIGVIGVGRMGEQHIRNVVRLAGRGELAALHDVDNSRALSLAASCGGPAIFEDPRELIASEDVDAILVASPDATHATLVLACIDAGKPVLCEKPMASNLSDAELILEAESRFGRRLVSLGFQRRFDPAHLAVRETALAGQIGRPLLWKGVHRTTRAPYDSSGPFIIANTAGHDIDSARWLLGEEVLEVSAKGLRSQEALPPDSRDLILLDMVMSGERLATAEIYVSASYGYEVCAELVGQFGVATTVRPDRLVVRARGGCGSPVAEDWTTPFQDAYAAELNAWIESVAPGLAFAGACAWDGYAAMAVSAAASASLLENRPRPVEIVKRPELYRAGGRRIE